MREIKFRAWVLTRKEMGPAETLNLILPPGLITHGVPSASVVLRVRPEDGMPNYHKVAFSFPTNAVVLMQFTGLLDKNGKEIYEGDIVRIKINQRYGFVDRRGQITSERLGDCMITFDDGDGIPLMEALFNPNIVEIIGNIYENQELLTR